MSPFDEALIQKAIQLEIFYGYLSGELLKAKLAVSDDLALDLIDAVYDLKKGLLT